MRRLVTLVSLCAMLIGISVVSGHTQTISIINDGEMMIDVNLRDAELSEVLTALFNTTNGKYQLRMGNNVVGRINRLNFAGVPFDAGEKSALNTILKAAGTFSVLKEAGTGGTVIYTINGPQSAVPTPTPPITPVMAPPTADTKLGPTASKDFNPNGFLSYASKSGTTTGTQPAGSTTSGDPAGENEISVIKMVGINYIDLYAFTDACGYSTVELFNQDSYGGSGSSGDGSNGYNNNNTNNNGINGNSRSNRTTNNGINNNNTSTRSTRTTNNNTNRTY
ncbi:MAG: hypothetical protein ACYDBB_15610 [Armatimonadota bacterium]